VLACPVFSSAPSLRSTNSGFGRPTPFAGFAATMEGSDFSPRASSASAHHLPDAGQTLLILAGDEISRFPRQGAYAHAGVYDRAEPSRRSR
jgi:hypothetical protein